MAEFGTRQADLPSHTYTEGLIVLGGGHALQAGIAAAAGERLPPVHEGASTLS